jgi:hypothetical protein
MGLTDKALEILLGALLLATLVFLGFQEVELRHELSTANRSLDNEIQCRVGSSCATRLAAEAAQGATLVQQARAAADTQAQAQVHALQQQAVDAVRGATAAQAQAAQEALTWKQKYQKALTQPDCATWARQAVVCAVH